MIYKLTNSEKIVLETIRKNNDSLKSKLVEKSNLPWATVTTAINSLFESGHIDYRGEKNEIVHLNNDSLYFIGLSLGTSNVKISITSMLCEELELSKIDKNNHIEQSFKRIAGYKAQKENRALWCFVTPSNYVDLSNLLSEICRTLLMHLEKINIAAICFVFPGHIDVEHQTIVKSTYSNLTIQASNIESILDNDVLEIIQERNIHICIDHNVKASTAYELSNIAMGTKSNLAENMAVLYLGVGLGVGMVINGKLFRGGSQNLAGQLGHSFVVRVPDSYIEDYFSESVSEFNNYKGCEIEKLEDILKKDIFYKLLGTQNDDDGLGQYRKTEVEKLKEMLLSEDLLYRRKLAFYLGGQICNMVKMLSINTFVFSGKLAALYPAFKAELQYVIMKNECQININFIVSNNGEYSAALGAAEMAYRNTFDMNDIS